MSKTLDKEYFDLFFGTARWEREMAEREKLEREIEDYESQQRQHETKTI